MVLRIQSNLVGWGRNPAPAQSNSVVKAWLCILPKRLDGELFRNRIENRNSLNPSLSYYPYNGAINPTLSQHGLLFR